MLRRADRIIGMVAQIAPRAIKTPATERHGDTLCITGNRIDAAIEQSSAGGNEGAGGAGSHPQAGHGRLTPGLSEQGGEARLLEVPVAEVR